MKRGITVSILVVTVVLMLALVTTSTVVGTRAIQTASYEEFLSKVERVANDVNKYVVDNGSLPITSEIIAKEGLPEELKAELKNKQDYTNNLFVIDMTKLRTESVNIGNGSVEDMDVFIVAENTNNVYYLKGVVYRGETHYGLDVIFESSETIPGDWEENVVAIVDTVPIPKGFVASQATGEDKKNTGLVIYEGTKAVTDANVETAKRTRNQYVWVPVDDFSKFVRQNFGLSNTISNTLGTNYWEVVLDKTTNMPNTIQSTSFVTSTTLAEVQAMYESVKEYKGFYIARYEAGLDIQRTSDNGILETNIYSMMGKIPYTYIPWTKDNDISKDTGGAVEAARSVYPEINEAFGVVSTLTYGVQWDRTLAWWLEIGAKDGKGNKLTSVTTSTSYGNYYNHEIAEGDLNVGTRYAVYTDSLSSYQNALETSTKKISESWILSTGALKVASVNNIYDMAGNMWEWTMEGRATSNRIRRGGGFRTLGNTYSVGYRDVDSPQFERRS